MFIPVSQAVADLTRLEQYKVPYRVINNFVPSDIETRYDDDDARLAQLPPQDYLLFVGDIRRDKGVDVLFQAYADLQNAPPLVLIGKTISDLTVSAPPNTLNLQSWPHTAVMSAWRRCTLGLVPSITPDTCPLVATEAMAMGHPVIGSRIGGLTSLIVDGETGFLVPPGDVRALKEATQCLLDDPARRERMGIQARQHVKKFYAREIVPCVEQVYEELVAR